MRQLLMSVALLALAPATSAEVTFLANSANYGGVHVNLVNPSSFPARVVNGVVDGMAQWNDQDCNTNQERFPTFSMTATAGDPRIDVVWVSSSFSATTEAGHTVCAEATERTLDGSYTKVLLYRQTRFSDDSVRDCYDSRGIANDSFAHELGHYLGLFHPTCDSTTSPMIMGPRSSKNINGIEIWDTGRSVRAMECDAADNKNETPPEAECQRGDPSCDPEADPASPILVDLDGGGFRLSGADDAVLFDLDADGENEWLSWPVADSGDAFLCWDRNKNGLIDDGRELFGDATVLVGGAVARNGYLAFAEIDHPVLGGNADGLVGPGDGNFPNLCLWADRNRDGISQLEEITSPQAEGIVAFEYEPRESRRQDRHGNEFRFSARAWQTHRGVLVLLKTVDVFLRTW